MILIAIEFNELYLYLGVVKWLALSYIKTWLSALVNNSKELLIISSKTFIIYFLKALVFLKTSEIRLINSKYCNNYPYASSRS
jgi:hypothetical protein